MRNGTYPEHCSYEQLVTLMDESEITLIGEGSFHFAFLVKLKGGQSHHTRIIEQMIAVVVALSTSL